MADLKPGKNGKLHLEPFPILAMAGGGKIFMTAGGGGSRSTKEVPNVVQVYSYDEATEKITAVASMDTGKDVVVYLSKHPTSDEKWLASAKESCKVLSLDLEEKSLKEVCSFVTEEEGTVKKPAEQNFAKFSTDGSMIVTGGTDGVVKLWKELDEPKLSRSCGKKTKEIVDADFSHDSKLLAACDGSGVCRLWELAKGEDDEGKVLTYETSKVKGRLFIKKVSFFKNAGGELNLLMAANGPRGPAFLGIFDISGKKYAEVKVGEEPMKCVSFDGNPFSQRDNLRVVVGLASGEKKIFTCPSLKQLKNSGVVHDLPAEAVVMLGEKTAISCSGDRTVHFIDASGGGLPLMWIILVLVLLLGMYLMLIQQK